MPSPNRDIPDYQVLDFYYDHEYSCALTVFIHNLRLHIIADGDALKCRLTGSRSNSAGREYLRLYQDVKQANEWESSDDSGTNDSGVDLRPNTEKATLTAEDAERALQDWMLKPLRSTVRELAPTDADEQLVNLDEWYNRPTHFFELGVTDGELSALALESNPDLEWRISALTPEIGIPKYIRESGVPWFRARDLVVLSGSASPPPYRPARVRHGEETYFLKLVDSTEPQPTKREIPILRKIGEKGLHELIRVPKLEGLVTFDDRTKLLGFLQTDIPDPVPLTTKLDADVPQQLRDRWAAEADRIKEVLHENDLVWGDAKADNFMVDADNQLWIIDFGGSYTEGWVDPAIQETAEGDDMGVRKITNALHDPVANVWDLDEEATVTVERELDLEQEEHDSPDPSCKRKSDDQHDSVQSKRSKRQHDDTEETENVYCYCDTASSGNMIACDSNRCEKQWFHFDCVGIVEAPPDDQAWHCDDCRDG